MATTPLHREIMLPIDQVNRVRDIIRELADERWNETTESIRLRIVAKLHRALGDEGYTAKPPPIVDLLAFQGDDDDERMVNALAWAEAVDGPVTIITDDARLTEISVFGLPDVTFIGRAL